MSKNHGYTSVLSEKDIELSVGSGGNNDVISAERANSNVSVIKKLSNISIIRKNTDTDLLSHEVEIHDDSNPDFEYNHIGLSSQEAEIRLRKVIQYIYAYFNSIIIFFNIKSMDLICYQRKRLPNGIYLCRNYGSLCH